MLTVLAYVIYVRKPGLRRYALVVLLFVLGLMAKPMLVTLPFTLLLLDLWPLGRFTLNDRGALPRLLREKIPLFALSAGSSIVTFLVQRSGGAVESIVRVPIPYRITNAVVAYSAYIGKMLWPERLAVLYTHSRSIPGWWLIAALALTAVSVIAIRTARWHPYIPVGWFWYVGTLVPVIGLVQVGSQSMADRYTYVPLIGLFVVAAWAVPEVLRAERLRRTIPISAAAVIVICVIATRVQLAYWKDSVSLWQRTLAITTDNSIGHNNLGFVLAAQGKPDEAIAHYREALRIDPRYADAHNNLGIRLAAQGKLDQAIEHFTAAVGYQPTLAKAHNNLANALGDKDRIEEALAHYAEALRLKPDYANARFNLATTLSDATRFSEAIPEYSEALRLQPDYADAHRGLGIALAKTGKSEEAIKHFNEALRLRPGDTEARRWLDSIK